MSDIVNEAVQSSVYSFEVLPFIREIENTIYRKKYQLALRKLQVLMDALEEAEENYMQTWESNHKELYGLEECTAL
jgi:hypothetical protein